MYIPVYVELNNEQMDFLVRLMNDKRNALTTDIKAGVFAPQGIQVATEQIIMMSKIISSFTDGIKMITEVIEEMGDK